MGRDVLSVRQMMVLLMVALLAPATDLLPSLAAQQVGSGGWLVALGALPLLLLALWICGKVFCGRGVCAEQGKPIGYTIIIIYLFWILLTLTAVLRLSAARMEETYGGVPPFFFAVVLAAVAVWMGTGKASALARAAEIFYLVLAVVLIGVLLLAAAKVEKGNLYPIKWSAVPGGSLAAAGLLFNVVPAAVLGKRVPQKVRSARGVCGWTVVFSVVLTLLLAAVIGCIGPGLSARLETPYFVMVQGLGVKGAFQRTEALVAAIWMLSDLILAGLLLRAWCDFAEELHSGTWGRWSALPAAAAALFGGWILFPEGEDIRLFCETFLPMAGLVLGLIVPVFLRIISVGRKKKRR